MIGRIGRWEFEVCKIRGDFGSREKIISYERYTTGPFGDDGSVIISLNYKNGKPQEALFLGYDFSYVLDFQRSDGVYQPSLRLKIHQRKKARDLKGKEAREVCEFFYSQWGNDTSPSIDSYPVQGIFKRTATSIGIDDNDSRAEKFWHILDIWEKSGRMIRQMGEAVCKGG